MIGVLAYTGVAAAAVVRHEYLKSQQVELTDSTRSKINSEGLYHITSKEAAEKIIASGYLLPTKGVMDNHFAQSRYGDGFADYAYMFAGKPTVEMFKTNLSHQACKDGTIYAVRYKPDQFDIENYTERLSDGAITHEGILDIGNSRPELVRMKIERGQLVEIPWDEPVKPSFIQSLKELKALKFCRSLPSAFRELKGNLTFRDTEGKLARSRTIRKERNKMLEQYNNDTQQKEFTIALDGEEYTITTSGTKMNDGRPLSGFRVSKNGTDFEKNIFMDAFDITSIPEEKLGEFISRNMDIGVQSEYLGKPVMVGDEVTQEMDQDYLHHFNAKQLRVVENNPVYAAYVEAQNKKKNLQLSKLKESFRGVSSKARADALEFVEMARSGKFKEKAKEAVVDFVRDESSGFVLGG